MTTADAPPGHPGAGAEGVVAGYRVEGLLRRHSPNDAVYAATQAAQGRNVELRVLTTQDPDLRARFEATVAQPASIVHPNLPAAYDSGEAPETVFLATARVDGVELAEAVKPDGLPLPRAIRLLGSVADALDAVHRQGFAHGDVRLENVVLVQRHVEHPYLVDFALDGTAEADRRAFAASLFACLTGAPPAAHGAGAPRLDQVRPGMPEPLGRLLAEAMSGSGPASRHSPGELMNEVARYMFVTGPPPAAPPPAEPRREPPAPPPRVAPTPPRVVPPPAQRKPAAPSPAPWTRLAPPPPPPARPTPARPPSPPAEPAAPAPAEQPAPAASRTPPGEARPAPTAAPAAAAPRRRIADWRVPPIAAVAVVAVAAVAGFLVGRPGGDEPGAPSEFSSGALSISLPDGWSGAEIGPRIRGLDFAESVSASGPGGLPALVAGRLAELRGSVYTAAVAERVDPTPPQPAAVSFGDYEAFSFRRVDGGGAGRVQLYVAPTGGGTLVAACLAGAPRECASVAGSLRLAGAMPSGLAAGTRFAGRLDRELAGLAERASVASVRLRSAALSPGQAGAATDLARAYGAARRALALEAAPPAAQPAQRRLVRSLARAARSYRSLARAAARRRRAAFKRAGRSARVAEADLRSLLRRL